MDETDFAEDYDADVGEGGGKVKRAVGVIGVLAVLIVLLKLKRRGGSSSGSSESSGSTDDDYVELDERDERDGVDTVSTASDDEEETTDSDSDDGRLDVDVDGRRIANGRLEELDVVDYLAILAAALQAARDEYRIRTQ